MMSWNYKVIVLLIFIFAIATIIRVVNLGEPSFAADESYQFFAAKSLLEEGRPILPSGNSYTRALPYSRLVALSMSLFGVNEMAARLPSVIFGVLTVMLVYFWSKKHFNITVGLITAFLVSLSPVEIAWSRECRFYSAFVLFYLLGVFSFYNGFERDSDITQSNDETGLNKLLSGIYKNYGFSQKQVLWLTLSLISFLTAFKLQSLTGMFYFSIIAYFIIMFFITVYGKNIKLALQSKYFFYLLMIVPLTLLGFLLFPHLLAIAKENYNFMPAWARMRSAGPAYYFRYLFSLDFFPLGALLLIGSFQVITRFSKPGFYLIVNFMVPILMHTFIAKVKNIHYISYLYTFFLMIAAYAIYNLLESEGSVILRSIEKYKEKARINIKTVKIGLVLILILIMPLTWWFRDGIGLMFLKPGKSPALEHPGWRQATGYLIDKFEKGDIIVTTLPLNMLYYFGKVDYHLDNGIMYDTHIYNKQNERGFFIDSYAHKPVIENLEQLKKVINIHSRGWLVMDRMRFNNPANVPVEIRKYVEDNLIPHEIAGDNSMVIFEWENG